jgi:hypothetical protein
LADLGPPEVFKLVLGGAIVAELVGVPVAWVRLRNTEFWSNRPEGVRSLDLLSRFVRPVTGFAAVWALVIALGAVLGSVVA